MKSLGWLCAAALMVVAVLSGIFGVNGPDGANAAAPGGGGFGGGPGGGGAGRGGGGRRGNVAPAATMPASGSPIIADGANLTRVGSGYGFTEGPAVDRDGNVLFTDQNNDQIVKWTWADNKCTQWLKPAGRANGSYIDADNNFITCADEKNEMWKIAPDKSHTVIIKNYQGKYLNGPNDLWVRPDGGIYFTDPYFDRQWWDHHAQALDKRAVYFFSADGKTYIRVIDDFQQPNGIIGTQDGKTLYVADMNGRQTFKYDIQPDGKLTNKTPFCNVGSDGMSLDEQGNVYCTDNGVQVFDKNGKLIERIAFQEQPANLTFAGPDRKTLFFTARTSVYTLKMKVRGADEPAKWNAAPAAQPK